MEEIILERRSKLAALSKTLTIIPENRDNIIKDLAALRTLVPEVNNLPDELLPQIFMDAIDMEEDKRRSLAMDWGLYRLGKMPITISAVCRRWRRVALGTPSLWRYVNLTSGEDQTWVRPPVLEHWLAYGSLHNREISLDVWRREHLNPLPSSLAIDPNNCIKLRRIEISCVNEETCLSSSEWPSHYPLANEVVVLSEYYNRMSHFFLPLVSQAQKLAVSQIGPSWGMCSWGSLEELTITGPQYPTIHTIDIFTLFHRASNLSRLSIKWEPKYTDNTIYQRLRPFTHSQFRYLTCSFDVIDLYLDPLQESILLPNLTELVFHTALPGTSRFLLGWSAALKLTSPSPLRHLQLPQIDNQSLDDFVSLFNLLPCLERLSLTGDTVDALLQQLIIDDMGSDTPTILPSLARLDIRDSNVMDATLERLITSRLASNRAREGVQEIEVVNIYESPGITPQGWQRILALLAAVKN